MKCHHSRSMRKIVKQLLNLDNTLHPQNGHRWLTLVHVAHYNWQWAVWFKSPDYDCFFYFFLSHHSPRTFAPKYISQVSPPLLLPRCHPQSLPFLRFIVFWERKRESMTGRGRVEERENLKQTPHWAWSLTLGLISRPWDHDLSQMLSWLCHPGVPHPSLFC